MVAVDPRLMAAMQRFVERRGLADVVTAWGVEQARELLAGIHFDVVIIDIDLPYGRGQQLMVEVAVSHPGTRRVGIGRASRRGLRTMVDAGLVDDAVAKPVDMDEFLQATFGIAPGSTQVARDHQPRISAPGVFRSGRARTSRDLRRPAAVATVRSGIPHAVLIADSTPLPI